MAFVGIEYYIKTFFTGFVGGFVLRYFIAVLLKKNPTFGGVFRSALVVAVIYTALDVFVMMRLVGG